MRFIKGLMLVGTLIFVVWGIIALFPKVSQTRSIWQENKRLAEEVKTLKVREEALGEKLRELQDPRMVEREAKQRLQLRRPGETVVVIVPREETVASVTPEAAAFSDFIGETWRALRAFFLQ